MTMPEQDAAEWLADKPNLTEWDYADSEDPQTYNDTHH
jgi:hypothetical protein